MNKKADGFGIAWVIIVMIAALTLVAFWPFVQWLLGFIIGTGDDAACTLSLIGGEGTANCPIDEVHILEDKIEINGKTFIKKPNSGTTEEMAKRGLAKLLQVCLKRGGGLDSGAFEREFLHVSDSDLFNDDEGQVKSSAVCLECATITLDREVGQITDLIGYLRDTHIGGEDSEKILDDLTKDSEHKRLYQQIGLDFRLSPGYDVPFSPDEKYSLMFVGMKEREFGGSVILWNEYLFTYEDLFFTYIVESNRVGSICGAKVN